MSKSVDIYVGKRIRQRRWLIGMSQKELGIKVGLRFQQIQKYETGNNRVSASRLWDISRVLDVSVTFFFDGLEHYLNECDSEWENVLDDHHATMLVVAYYKIPEAKRKLIYETALLMAVSETFD